MIAPMFWLWDGAGRAGPTFLNGQVSLKESLGGVVGATALLSGESSLMPYNSGAVGVQPLLQGSVEITPLDGG